MKGNLNEILEKEKLFFLNLKKGLKKNEIIVIEVFESVLNILMRNFIDKVHILKNITLYFDSIENKEIREEIIAKLEIVDKKLLVIKSDLDSVNIDKNYDLDTKTEIAVKIFKTTSSAIDNLKLSPELKKFAKEKGIQIEEMNTIKDINENINEKINGLKKCIEKSSEDIEIKNLDTVNVVKYSKNIVNKLETFLKITDYFIENLKNELIKSIDINVDKNILFFKMYNDFNFLTNETYDILVGILEISSKYNLGKELKTVEKTLLKYENRLEKDINKFLNVLENNSYIK